MAIKYPIKHDYADKRWVQQEARRVLLDEHELKLIDDDFEASSVSKVAVAIAITTVLLLSLYLFNTQAKASDGNVMPISPMSLVDHLGEE
jgi:hypothetical protein